MVDDSLREALGRVSSWPPERQQELAELVAEIESEVSGEVYHPSADELAAIDEGLADDVATADEIAAAFAALRRK